MSDRKLAALLEQGDADKCAAFFHRMTEKERRALAPQCASWQKKVLKNEFIESPPGTFSSNPLLGAAAVAVFATATYSEIRKQSWAARPGAEHVYDILVDRRPQWVGAWVITLLDQSYYWTNWRLVRRLMAAGLLQRPKHANYYLGMISGLGRFNTEASIEQMLLDSPDLLEHEVWRLFEYEGGGENSLANWDRFSRGQTWSDALLALVKKGKLSRERLLDCSLEALERDFNHYRAKWFANFYDALEPTAEEQSAHRERLLHLLGATAPNIVTWAFKRVQILAKGGTYEAEVLIAGLEPVLRLRQKGIIKKALKLIHSTSKGAPAQASHAALVCTAALGHEATDLQESALQVIESLGSADNNELAEQLAVFAALVAPSLQSRLQVWTGSATDGQDADLAAEQPVELGVLEKLDATSVRLFGIDELVARLEQGRLGIPAARFDGTELSRLRLEQAVQPIEELEELIEVCSRVLESESLVHEAERAIDGLSRLCDVRPEDFEQRTGPLLKRATQLLKRDAVAFVGMGPRDDLCGLVYAWGKRIVLWGEIKTDRNGTRLHVTVEGEKISWWANNLDKPPGFLSRRAMAVAHRVAAGRSATLLSAPTHRGGWIRPAVLVQRANHWTGEAPDSTDVCLALLRLAPDGRQAALAQLTKGTAEWKRAIRYALGGARMKIGKAAALWIAAARSRSPLEDDQRVAKAFAKHGPDAGLAARYSLHLETDKYKQTHLQIRAQPPPPVKVEPDCVTVAFHQQRGKGYGLQWELGGIAGRSEGTVRWTATIWPLARESYFAGAAHEIANNLDWWEARWQNKALLEPLLDPGTPLRDMGLLLLALGLGAKEAGESGLAIDIAIGAIEDGRLGSDNLGTVLAELLTTGLIKPGRWYKTLGEVSRISELHALVVQLSLQHALRGEPKQMPRNFGSLLEMLKELSIQLGLSITQQPCRVFLAGIRGSSKAAKMAKALLALEPDLTGKNCRRLLRLALAQRITAAENTHP